MKTHNSKMCKLHWVIAFVNIITSISEGVICHTLDMAYFRCGVTWLLASEPVHVTVFCSCMCDVYGVPLTHGRGQVEGESERT
jgi:hypothetical protein